MILVVILFGILFSSNLLYSQSDEITQKELWEHINYLASDSLKGRLPGTDEDYLAANYILNQFKIYGLKPLCDDGFQTFDIIVGQKAIDECMFKFDGYKATLNKEFTPLPFSGDKTVSREIVFIGYGLENDPDTTLWNDYYENPVKDKIAMIMLGRPHRNNDSSSYENTSYFTEMRTKALSAKDNGALGVVFVSPPGYHSEDELIKIVMEQIRVKSSLPLVHITRKLADKILKSSGYTIASLEEKINSEMKPTHFIIQEKATINVEIEYIKEQTQNVVALLDNKSEQYIVIGAHYDHLGMGGYGSGSRRPDTVAVHNGADDNASGVSSVLEIAQKLSSLKNKLQKNVIFVAFTAEEMGLLGSTFFTNNSPVPIKNIDCMINLDMVGRIDSVEKKFTISGAGTAKELTDLINNLNLNQDYKFKLQNEGYGPSDHAPFYAKDIPVLFFFGKVHEDYHTPFDDIDKINFDGIKNVSDFITDLVVKLSSKEIDLTYQEAGPKEDTLSKKVSLKVTLGIMPDFTATDTKGVVAGAVTKGKPAYKAGMEKGDIIIALDGKPVDNIYEYMNRLNEFAKGQIITVDVIRNGEKKVLILQF